MKKEKIDHRPGYKIRDPEGIYFITFTVVEWIDVFTRRIYKDILIDSLEHCVKTKGLKVYAYVIMSNHVHLIVSTTGEKLEDIIRDYKKFTAKKIIEIIDTETESRRTWLIDHFEKNAIYAQQGSQYKFWKSGYHPIHLSTKEMQEQRLKYLHENPVKAGWVSSPEEYLYSSANAYTGRETILKVTFLE
jgi:REP element-mobilizing transposase RayT